MREYFEAKWGGLSTGYTTTVGGDVLRTFPANLDEKTDILSKHLNF
jgi:hypothetical protein